VNILISGIAAGSVLRFSPLRVKAADHGHAHASRFTEGFTIMARRQFSPTTKLKATEVRPDPELTPHEPAEQGGEGRARGPDGKFPARRRATGG